MKKALSMLAFVLAVASAWAQRAVLFDKVALGEESASAIKTIERDFKGKFAVDEWGGYEIKPDATLTVWIWFEEGKVEGISAEKRETDYSTFLSVASKVLAKYGQPQGTYYDEFGYHVYWWASAKGVRSPFDVRVSVSFEKPYVVREAVFYGK